MIYLEKLIVLVSLAILASSCTQQKTVESTEDLIGMREQKIERKDLGGDISEIMTTLRSLATYSELITYAPKEVYKSNLKIRKLDFNSHQIFENFFTKSNHFVRVNYVIRNDSILYGIVESIDSKSEYRLIEDSIFKREAKFIKDYVGRHNTKYETSKTSEDFIHEMNDIDALRIACGYTGRGYGEIEKEVLRDLDPDLIRSLLTSFNPENQTRGIVGMMKLQEVEYPLTQNDSSIIKMHLARDTKIFGCKGCTFDFGPMTNYMDSFDWKEIPNVVFSD